MVLTVLTTKKSSDQLEIQFVVRITLKHFRKMWFLFATSLPPLISQSLSHMNMPIWFWEGWIKSTSQQESLDFTNSVEWNPSIFSKFWNPTHSFYSCNTPTKAPAIRIGVANAGISCKNNHFISLRLHILQTSVKIHCPTWIHPYGVSRQAKELHEKNIP